METVSCIVRLDLDYESSTCLAKLEKEYEKGGAWHLRCSMSRDLYFWHFALNHADQIEIAPFDNKPA